MKGASLSIWDPNFALAPADVMEWHGHHIGGFIGIGRFDYGPQISQSAMLDQQADEFIADASGVEEALIQNYEQPDAHGAQQNKL